MLSQSSSSPSPLQVNRKQLWSRRAMNNKHYDEKKYEEIAMNILTRSKIDADTTMINDEDENAKSSGTWIVNDEEAYIVIPKYPNSKIVQDVVKDVPRSFGDSLVELDSPSFRAKLTEVLLVFSHYGQIEIGYTQGMGFITALALKEMSNDCNLAFWLLVDICESLPPTFFRNACHDEVDLFGAIVTAYAPLIKEHLENDFEGAMVYFLVQMMLPMFVHSLPLEITCAIWDFIFLQTEQNPDIEMVLLLHKFAFAILEIHSAPLLSMYRNTKKADVKAKTSGMEFITAIIRAASNDHDISRLIRVAGAKTISTNWLREQRSKLHEQRLAKAEEMKASSENESLIREEKVKKQLDEDTNKQKMKDDLCDLNCANPKRKQQEEENCVLL